ncbi:hypothetical protein [Streptomyces sp. NPDC015131]|uniref:hypothetical protein n=1 Tax=Streptomyces sp. NPDC015131 TaxID=3364941 RepID=UPI003702D31C
MSGPVWVPTAEERAELDAGFGLVLAERDARLVREAVRDALPVLADAIEGAPAAGPGGEDE